MLATKHESVVVGACACKHCQSFWVNDEKFMTAPVFNLHVIGGEFVGIRSYQGQAETLADT